MQRWDRGTVTANEDLATGAAGAPVEDATSTAVPAAGENAGSSVTQLFRRATGPSLRVLWINAAVLLIALFALVPLIYNGSIFMPDEGVYLKQAEALSEGRWSSPYPASDVDPDGVLAALTDGGFVDGRVVHYHRHALYPLLLTPAFAAAGQLGAMTLSILGTWSAAIAAAFIARGVKRPLGVGAMWLAGLASPLFFDAYQVVGHSIAAALAGVAFLGATRAVRDGQLRHLWYALPAVAAVVALRTEGAVFAVALAGAVGLIAIGWRPFARFSWRDVAISVSIIAAAGIAYLLDSKAATALVPTTSLATDRIGGPAIDPVRGAWVTLLQPFNGGWQNVSMAIPLVVGFTWLAAIALRARPTHPLLPLASLGLAMAAALTVFTDPTFLISGFFSAFPLAVVGIVWLRRSDFRSPTVIMAVATCLAAAFGILITNYGVGGATEWGGRFLHLLLPIFIPLVAIGCSNAAAVLPPRPIKWALGAAAVTVLCFAWASLNAQVALRTMAHDLVNDTTAFISTVGDDELLVIPIRTNPDGLARLFWEEDVNVLANPGISGISPVMRAIDRSDRDQALFLSDINPLRVALVLNPILKDLGWEITRNGDAARGSIHLFLIQRIEE